MPVLFFPQQIHLGELCFLSLGKKKRNLKAAFDFHPIIFYILLTFVDARLKSSML